MVCDGPGELHQRCRSTQCTGHRTLDWKTGERGLFGRESVRTILQNRAYLGYVSSGGMEYPGSHPSLITLELWEECTHIRDARTRAGGVVKVQPLEGEVLAQLIYCAACGSRSWNDLGRQPGRQVTTRHNCTAARAMRSATRSQHASVQKKISSSGN